MDCVGGPWHVRQLMCWFSALLIRSRMNTPQQPGEPTGDPRIRSVGSAGPRNRGALLAALVMVTIVGVLLTSIGFAWWLEPPTRVCGGCTNPLYRTLALSPSRDSNGTDSTFSVCATTPCNFYNFSVTVNSSSLTLADLFIEVVDLGGTIVTVQVGAAVFGPLGDLLGSYNFTLPGWAPAPVGSTHLADRDTIVVYAWGLSSQILVGGRMALLGAGAYVGTVSAALG